MERLEAFREACLPADIKRHVRERLSATISDPSAIDLIDKLLVIDPAKRLTADQALSHDYFYENPPAGDLRIFSREGSSYLEFFNNRHLRGGPQQQAQIPQAHHMYHPGHHPRAGQGRIPLGNQARRPPFPEDNIHHDRIY